MDKLEAKRKLHGIVEQFDAILLDAADAIRKSRATLKVAEIDELYKVLGCIAVDFSVFSELVDRIEDKK